VSKNVFRVVAVLSATLALVMSLSARPVAQVKDGDWPAFVNKLEADAINGRIDQLKTARVEMLRMLAVPQKADQTPALRYTIAYAGWRMAFAPTVPAAEQQSMLEDAVVQLNTVLKTSVSDVESLGLLAAVNGARIAKSPELGMTLGPESGGLIGRALRLAPNNPRLLLISGQSAFNTPPEYGGSVSQAEASFRASLVAFTASPASAAWPNWGRFDAHAWLGQALARRGDKPGARAEYEKALAIAPESAWVRFSLLPGVK
jgi:tetratricopeptide repeat protein